MKKILLYGHGGAYNHGAEAILRASLPLFRWAGAPIFLSTHFPEQDREFGLDKLVDCLIPADLSMVSEERAAGTFAAKERAAAEIYRDALAEINSETICVGVGGDNYCYPNWYRQSIFSRVARERGGKNILWGCSVQPEMIDGYMEETLRGHDHIFARESLTANALLSRGIRQVTCLPDPAFLLTGKPVPWQESGSMAAVNLSPLALRRSVGLMDAFATAAENLLESVETLLFIPHVTMPADNDVEALQELERRLSPEARDRIRWAPEFLNAEQRKYLISLCKALVCCRTHISIAAYSSGVPTLTVGYSVKAQGIAEDLGMGRWTLPVEACGCLPALVSELWENRREIRACLLAQTESIRRQYDGLAIGELGCI